MPRILMHLLIVFLTAIGSVTPTLSLERVLPREVILENGIRELQQQRYRESADWFTRLIELEPFSARAYKYRAAAYMELKDYDLAIQDLTSAANLDPELAGVHNNLGAAWFQKQDYEKARLNYSIEVRQRPESFAAYFNRAMALEKLGRLDDALADIETVIRLKPDNDMALCYKAEVLTELNRKEQAEQALKKALDINPQNPWATRRLEKQKNLPEPAFAVQAGAFHQEENARALLQKIEAAGFAMTVFSRTDGNGTPWHMVRKGPLTKKEANTLRARLKKATGIDAVVRPHGAF